VRSTASAETRNSCGLEGETAGEGDARFGQTSPRRCRLDSPRSATLRVEALEALMVSCSVRFDTEPLGVSVTVSIAGL